MRWKLFVLLIISSPSAIGQQFGGNPPSLKWQQVNSKAARVIFPRGLDTTARQVATIIDQLNQKNEYKLGAKLSKVNVVLQNQTTTSNGYVGLGPYRSEFYLTPYQNSFRLGSLAWHHQLALHEYRHVQQYTNFNVGLSKVFRTVFGEEGQALANALVVPNWFFEGDAVFTETHNSGQGRGRLPYFHNGYRSLWLANKQYGWMKLRNGSFKDYTPDHYQLGYLMVAYGNEKYGQQFWKNITKDAAAFKGLFYPFQRAVKKHTGQNYTEFRRAALNFFQQQVDTTTRVASTQRQVIDEEYPAFINDSSIVFVKSSYDNIPAFVIKTNTKEHRLRTKDVSVDNHFSYKNGLIVYASYHPDARWGWRDYGELNVLNVNTGKQQRISSRSKYFAPDINEDGKRIVAVHVGTNGKSQLHILNAKDGTVLQEVNNPLEVFYTYPKFLDNNHIVSAVRNGNGEMSLAVINITSGVTELLVPFSYTVIGFPAVHDRTIYFTASAGATDQLFAINYDDKLLQQVVSKTPEQGIGTYQVTVLSNKLLFSSFTANGFKLQESKNPAFQRIQVSDFIKTHDFSISSLGKDESKAIVFSSGNYAITGYSKSTRLFNFHSLEPFFDDPEYRLSVVGENILNTFSSEVFFNYNKNEEFKQIGFNATYGALFPLLSLGSSYIFDRRAFNDNGQPVYWNEGQARAGISVPFNLSRGRSITSLTAGTDYVIKQVSYKGAFKDMDGYLFSHINGYTSFTHQIQQARQHIYPRLAQAVRVDYNRALTYLEANQLVVSGNLYWPGLVRNHNLVINFGYHQRDTSDRYGFTSRFAFSRGYEAPNLRSMVKWGVNYHLPLAYPDAGVANIVYLSRLRANLFYDDTRGKVAYSNGLRINRNFRSTGAELFFDTKWWNEYSVSFGVRYSRLLDNDIFGRIGSNRYEFILPVNLFRR